MSVQGMHQNSDPTYQRKNSGSLGGIASSGASGGINDRSDSISAMAVYEESSIRVPPGYISSGTDGDNSTGGGNEKH